jgi:hypothetical protein
MRFQDIPVEEALNKMKERIGLNQMSLLVGAGMSCCACDLYASWTGLLTDMVASLFKDELMQKGIDVVQDNNYYCHYKLVKTAQPEDTQYVVDAINSIICREGVLTIPSSFAKRMGFRESIEAYVESHTPQIDILSNTISLFGVSQQIDKDKDLHFLTTMLNVGWNAIFTTNYDDLLRYASINVGNKSLTECCDATTLSLRRVNEMIVKLHGSIDFTHNRNGFDGDVHRKYVLTQEDYDDYPAKHEAFMQMMKISLLKDCFCLVGFSGKDPNFIAWITWVRDILEAKNSKVPGTVGAEDIKIFFIDCYDNPLDDATLQFFENHKIYRIILSDAKKLFVCNGTEPRDLNERNKWLLDSFFSYIKNEPEFEVEPKDIPESYTLWSKAYTMSGNRFQELTVNVPEANELLSMRPYMRIVRGTHYQSSFLNAISKKNVLTELEAKLALLALEQQMYVGEENVATLDKIKRTLRDNESQERLFSLEKREITFQNPNSHILSGNTDRIVYERCLRFAFTFDFLALKKTLEKWTPSPDFVIKKIVLFNLVDRDACRRMITTEMLDSIPTRIERYRATQLANILCGEIPFRFSVKDYASLSSTDLFSLRDWFFGKSLQPKETVSSYGLSNRLIPIKEEIAIRGLQFLAEAPTFVHLDNWSIVEETQWYVVAHMLFEKYPYPVMFYTTTLNDKETLLRIGQDYAYSKVLHKQLPDLVEKMFIQITDKNIPLSFWGRRNSYILLSELIKAVPPRYWNKYVMQLWSEHRSQLFANDNMMYSEFFDMLCSALSCTKDLLLISAVIRDTLELVRQYKRYDLAQNIFYYSRPRNNREFLNTVEPSVLKFVDGICDVRDFILLGNLNRIMNRKLVVAIAKSIPQILNKPGLRLSSVNGLIYFAKRDKKVLASVRKAIISSPSLWHNGVHDGGYSLCEFLPIVAMDQELKWTKEEVVAVYEKLVVSASQILSVNDVTLIRHMNSQKLYREMLRFIDLHRTEIQGVEFSDIYQQLEDKYKSLTSFEDIEKSIYSGSINVFSAALAALYDRIKCNGLKENLDVINIIISRILCGNKIGYEAALYSLKYCVCSYAKDRVAIESIPRLTLLLDSLTTEVFKDLEQNVYNCSELMILLAVHLHKYGVKCDGVSYWMDVKRSNFFNWFTCDIR